MFSFWKARMPMAHNGVESVKEALESGDFKWADAVAESNSKNLRKALEDTRKAIEKRDSGKSRKRDPDVEDGINW